jgi:hypothetical protein
MLKMLRAMLPKKSARKPRRQSASACRDARRVRPQLEGLERRDVPTTISYHGGPLLPNVEVQAMYYGSDWDSGPYLAQAVQLNSFLSSLVNSSFMDMLTKAGYRVGRGSASAGDLYEVNVDKTQRLTDAQIQCALSSEITHGYLAVPDANRLYVVFVEDNVAVSNGNGTSDNKDFYGYHSSFHGPTGQNVRYAVVTYPGGNIPLQLPGGPFSNYSRSWVFMGSDSMTQAFGNLTQSASHELAEAVTDPDPFSGWNDNNYGGEGEVGDLANNQTVYLNGYAVQRIADQYENAMTPMDATSLERDNFYLTTNGTLWMTNPLGGAYVDSNVASVSDQSVDNYGFSVVDYVTLDGRAIEYHANGKSYLLTSNARQAKAGQGVSYVLSTSGTVQEYKDTDYLHPITLDNTIQSIDAGTDQYGVNMITEVRRISYYRNGVFYTISSGYELSDSTGKHLIVSNVSSMSAGQQGFMDYITTSGDAYWYSEASAFSSYLGSGVAAVTAGTDQYGNYMIDLLYSNGYLWEWRQASGWNWLDYGVATIGKAHAGLLDVVFTGGYAYTHDSYSWYFLAYNVEAAA